MALRLRRGTDAERLLITPLEGELIYTTDTKKLYVGDGITLGGNAIDTNTSGGGLADLSNSSINDLGDVNADSTMPADGDVLAYDATSGDWRSTTFSLDTLENVDTAGVNDGEFLAYDLATDSWGPVNAGSALLEGLLENDIRGSVFGLDSTTIVDSINNTVNAVTITGTEINATSLVDSLEVTSDFATIQDLTAPAFNLGTGAISDVTIISGEMDGIFRGQGVGAFSGSFSGSVFTDGSTLMVDGINNNYFGRNMTLSQNLEAFRVTSQFIEGSLLGTLTGDVKGSVFGDDSSALVNGLDGSINAKFLKPDLGTLIINNEEGAGNRLSVIFECDDNRPKVYYKANLSGTVASRSDAEEQWAGLYFQCEDDSGLTTTVAVDGGPNWLQIGHDSTGAFLSDDSFTYFQDGKLGVGVKPTEKLDVNGNAKVGGFVQFGSLTYLERDALTPAAGMVIWNSDSSQFEGYNGSNWINLVDGSVSTAP